MAKGNEKENERTGKQRRIRIWMMDSKLLHCTKTNDERDGGKITFSFFQVFQWNFWPV